MTDKPADENCGTCMWARPTDLVGIGPDGEATFDMTIVCHRFPQAVTNSKSYFCGEYLRTPQKRGGQ